MWKWKDLTPEQRQYVKSAALKKALKALEMARDVAEARDDDEVRAVYQNVIDDLTGAFSELRP
jgi:hypothetical protein